MASPGTEKLNDSDWNCSVASPSLIRRGLVGAAVGQGVRGPVVRDVAEERARVGAQVDEIELADVAEEVAFGEFVAVNERALGDAGTMWAATRTGRVFVSKNADAAPAAVQFDRIDGDAGTPGRFVSSIAIDPADPNHAWVSYSGYDAFTPATRGHVFEVRYDPAAGTAAWADRSTNIGDQPVTSVAYAGSTGDVYAATDFGVLRRPAGSIDWEVAAADLPQVAVYGLTLS